MEVVGPEETGFSTRLETAVHFGKSILVEDLVGELPAALLPLIRGRSLRLADRTLPAQPGFKLYLATRSELLIDSLPSEASAVLVRISVGAGTSSLAERFVEKALLADTPELEPQRREALEKEEKLSGERDAARLDLLRQLGSARGQDLLEESRTGGGPGKESSESRKCSEKGKNPRKACKICRAFVQSGTSTRQSQSHVRILRGGIHRRLSEG